MRKTNREKGYCHRAKPISYRLDYSSNPKPYEIKTRTKVVVWLLSLIALCFGSSLFTNRNKAYITLCEGRGIISVSVSSAMGNKPVHNWLDNVDATISITLDLFQAANISNPQLAHTLFLNLPFSRSYLSSAASVWLYFRLCVFWNFTQEFLLLLIFSLWFFWLTWVNLIKELLHTPWHLSSSLARGLLLFPL